jgi:hypothetical protein
MQSAVKPPWDCDETRFLWPEVQINAMEQVISKAPDGECGLESGFSLPLC